MVVKSEYTVRVVGVTFEGRQRVVASLVTGQELCLRRESHNIHDSNAIRVECLDGRQIGYISNHLACDIASALDRVGGSIPAQVVKLTGGGSDYNHGVVISFRVSQDSAPAGIAADWYPETPSELQSPPWDSE